MFAKFVTYRRLPLGGRLCTCVKRVIYPTCRVRATLLWSAINRLLWYRHFTNITMVDMRKILSCVLIVWLSAVLNSNGQTVKAVNKHPSADPEKVFLDPPASAKPG